MGYEPWEFNKRVQQQIEEKLKGFDNAPEAGSGRIDGSVKALDSTATAQAGRMNKTEKRYSQLLQHQKETGEITDWRHEPFNLRLAKKTFYKPDFAVLRNDFIIEIHEVKGRWRDDALVKIKVAAEHLPWFRFIAAFYTKGVWEFRYF